MPCDVPAREEMGYLLAVIFFALSVVLTGVLLMQRPNARPIEPGEPPLEDLPEQRKTGGGAP